MCTVDEWNAQSCSHLWISRLWCWPHITVVLVLTTRCQTSPAAAVYFSFVMTSTTISPVEPVPGALRSVILVTSSVLRQCGYFLWDYLKDTVLHKDPYRIQELKFTIQSEIECLSTDTVTKFLRSFLLRLLNVHGLRGRHIENSLL